MNIKLNIPYSNKDKLKKYKIKWNNDYKIWYLEDYRNLKESRLKSQPSLVVGLKAYP
ncbi:TPA: hypothetical protein LGF61_001890 [Campylobacter coli]|nr:hypothetical protein [Campylobacter coli]HEF9391411.1 hypothetical protein [Campylobacter coli]